MNYASLRINYEQGTLLEAAVPSSPMSLFDQWFQDAASLTEPNAMCLSTCSAQAKPSSRMVLLKGIDHGFVFYTNSNSRKGKELAENPVASLVFWWGQRQVRVEGRVERVDDQTATAYFHSRPRSSQIGAWSSPQSQTIQTRQELDAIETSVEEKFANVDVIPKPEFWGGYRVIADQIEFWQGRTGRLHDRLLFVRRDTTKDLWSISRLAP